MQACGGASASARESVRPCQGAASQACRLSCSRCCRPCRSPDAQSRPSPPPECTAHAKCQGG
eukprot:7029615-Alexandrium_andersonii.AAC.1